MRTLLLLVLGAGIVWFVWRGLGPGQSTSGEAQAAPGSMLQVESGATSGESEPGDASKKPADAASDASGAPSSGANGARTSPEPERVSEAPKVVDGSAASALPDPAPEIDRGAGASTGTSNGAASAPGTLRPASGVASPAEVVAAEALLTDRVAFEAQLAARSTGLDPARQQVAAAFVHALSARESEARSALDRAQTSGALSAAERDLALRLVDGGSGAIVTDSALARAASAVAEERAAFAALDASRFDDAARSFSRLLLAEIESPWRANAARLERWSLGVREAQRRNRWNPRGKWRSTEVVVQPGDSLITVRKRAIAATPSLVVCTGQIARANGLEGEVIHPGMKLRIPQDAVHVLVDLDAHWAFYLADTEVIAAWPVGVGSESSTTRLGNFTVGAKKTKEPMWFPHGRKPVPFGDPANPLGTRWIPWNGSDGLDTGLGFHGTNDPGSIGRDASLGCIRMRTPDVEELYEILPVGAIVQVVP